MIDLHHGILVTRSRYPTPQPGFTLIEVLVALTILVMAGSALLLATHAAMDTTTDSLDQTIAQGIARQFLDEAMGLAYAEPGSDPLSPKLGAESGEDASGGRIIAFDDTDDFANYTAHPLVDPWGQSLGTGDDRGSLRHPDFQLNHRHFVDWGLTATVVYLDEDDPSKSLPAGVVSGVRALEVVVYKRQPSSENRVLATMRRVYSYVPAPQ